VINIAVFASGSGTNFQALVNYFAGSDEIRIKLLLCNRRERKVLERAERANIDSFVFTRDELENSSKLLEALSEHEIHFIVLAGFLLLIPEKILLSYPGRIINIHPCTVTQIWWQRNVRNACP
jgi:phosphoribosylglycinamide formyltransferase 1